MGGMRYGFFVGIVGAVVGLCLMAWRLSAATDALDELPAAASAGITGPIGQAQEAVATARLMQAWTVANVYLAQNGTLEGLSSQALRQLDPTVDPTVALAWVSGADACLETGQGAARLHLLVSAGPPPLPGPC